MSVYVPAAPMMPLGALVGRRRRAAAARFGPGASLHANGRAALAAGLRLLAPIGIRRVWLPAYVCRSVLDPILACGLEPALYDIDARLEPCWARVAPRAGDAFLLVHYFGLCGPQSDALRFCAQHKVVLIEDCAHGLFDPSADAAMGGAGAIAIYSLRKTLPVPDGGVLRRNDPGLPAPPPLGRPPAPSLKRVLVMLAERVVRGVGVDPLAWRARVRALAGTTDPGPTPRPGDDRGPSWLTLRLLETLDWEPRIAARRSAYARTVALLGGSPGVEIPLPELPAGGVPLGLPLRVEDPSRVCMALRAHGVGASQWPGADGLPDVDPGAFPGAAEWVERGILLPVHEDLRDRELVAMARAVRAVAPASRGPAIAGRA